ncbi:hypothetical protein ELI54_29990 (plasmid) [Rhizobium ruizarguesonis]|nr:hypothetical protein [Rhizobium ruizarguesonis]MBY5879409.1 hypothetical protein [Rhizobium leguminosarum]TAT75797.1 hypothetical protein ELI54_29990 [Rhizobium ruizarguesonis]TBE59609.1 hypothetical protein ELH00_31110 [Rhizobium ruizarguesonis]
MTVEGVTCRVSSQVTRQQLITVGLDFLGEPDIALPAAGTRSSSRRQQKGRSTLAGSALILSDNEQFDDVDTARIHFSGRTGIWTLSAGVSRGRSAVLHDN